MRIVVFGNTIKNAIYYTENLIKTIPENKIHRKLMTKSKITVELKDGTVIHTATVNEYCRGIKCNVAYVDRKISVEDLFYYIIPSLCENYEIIFY